jgi:hypothetical protein
MLKQTVQRSILLAGITLVSLSSAALSAQANNPGAQKWETEIAAFEADDKTNPPPTDAILVIGSSSIRLWHSLSQDSPEHKVIDRGLLGAVQEGYQHHGKGQ